MDEMDRILVLDFGGQYSQLIARRVREERVYAEIKDYAGVTARDVVAAGYKGIILTGGPNSVYDDNAPKCQRELLEAGVPVLGICYGAQLMAYLLEGGVGPASSKAEYGKVRLTVLESPLFEGVPKESDCWMSHRDQITFVPEGFRTTAHTGRCACAAMENAEKGLYAVQFHPEVVHTECGKVILSNFVYNICGCLGEWNMEDYARSMTERYRRRLLGRKVLLAVSGGVDSSVAAAFLHRAIGRDLFCVFVDHGMLRKGEAELVYEALSLRLGINLVRVDASERFLSRLAGVTDPEQKRRVVGEQFVRVFEEEAGKLGGISVLAQGTIYPDVIESGKGSSAVIKSHHNVGGLPSDMTFDEVVEPLRDLFKDEVRELGLALGLPEELVLRQPFPGPGLSVRVIGEVTGERLGILREADAIFRGEVETLSIEERPSQYFAVLTDTRSVGVMGDERSYGLTVALRAVDSDDFMTADWSRLPTQILERAAGRIVNEVRGVSRVVYDITSKPPATVEWE